MRRYQAVLILNPDIETKELDEFQNMFRKLLKKGKAENIEDVENGIRDMAHSIKKYPRTHFWRVAFDSETSLIDSLKVEIRHDERLLRQIYLDADASREEIDEQIATDAKKEPEKVEKAEVKTDDQDQPKIKDSEKEKEE